MIKKKTNSLAKSYEVSYKTNGSGGFSSSRALSFGEDVKFFKPVEGRNKISIIPYEIKTANHPLVAKGSLEVGDSDFKLDIWEHRGLGSDGMDSCVCLKKNYNKPCPICEEYERLKKEEDENADSFKPKRREYYNVLNKDGELQVFATSHYLFGKELIEEARDDEEGGFVDFADVDDGKAVKFRASKKSIGSGTEFLEFKSFSFEDRDEPIPASVLNKVQSLDALINVPTYDELKKLLSGQSDESEEEDDEDDEPPFSTSKSNDSEEKPPVRAGKKRVATEEEDDDPAPVKSKKSQCPFGHAFGTDCDSCEDCDNCDVWEQCYRAK